jgi:hypothetical protein
LGLAQSGPIPPPRGPPLREASGGGRMYIDRVPKRPKRGRRFNFANQRKKGKGRPPSRDIACLQSDRIDLIGDRHLRLHCCNLLDLRRAESGGPRMREIESLVEAYLIAERDLVAAVEAAGGTMPLPDGRTVTVSRAEFDALLGERRKRAWVIIRKQAPMPARR